MVFWQCYADAFQSTHVWLYINKLIKEGKYDDYLEHKKR